ncbi:MAG TPA: transglutaminase [Clostridiales bacterium]|jgi:hypothetical protein|nr:transglutaminase [Clostridiales bacterium]
MKGNGWHKNSLRYIILLIMALGIPFPMGGLSYLEHPDITTVDQWVLPGNAVKPLDFISEESDAVSNAISFRNTPDTSQPGEQDIILIIGDSSKRYVERKAKLTVLDARNTVSREAGPFPLDVTIDDFLGDTHYDASLITDTSAMDPAKPGTYPVKLKIDGRVLDADIKVVDTTPPTANTMEDATIWIGDEPKAETLVKDIADATAVTVRFREEYDFTTEGEQQVALVLTDTSGNESELTVPVKIKKDTEPPVISGAYNQQVYIGDTVSYKKGVTITDNRDQDITLNVDTSQVNLRQKGIYPVVYSAEDAAGNQATKEITIEVRKAVVSPKQVDKLCDKILKEITNPGMSQKDKAYAIYQWTNGSILYTGDSDKSDWMAEAYRGITKKHGDCFTYFSVSKALLTRAGIGNLDVTRAGGRTRHYWSMINCGDGWYHFDSSPHNDGKETFMMTDREVDKYTRKRGKHYYSFDKSQYPRTPEQ